MRPCTDPYEPGPSVDDPRWDRVDMGEITTHVELHFAFFAVAVALEGAIRLYLRSQGAYADMDAMERIYAVDWAHAMAHGATGDGAH